MKTEFEFTIPRTNGEDPCVATVSVAPDPNGDPSFEILVVDRRGEYVETRPDEDAEIIDKAIEKWGDAYARVFGDRHCDEAIRARVNFIEHELQPDAKETDAFPPLNELKPEVRLRLAQRLENWRAADRLSVLHPPAPVRRDRDEPDYDAPRPLTALENWQRNDEHNVP